MTVCTYSRKSLIWSGVDSVTHNLSPSERQEFLFDAPLNRERRSTTSNAPLMTRWCNVEGLEPLLVRKLALRYDLHPIALGKFTSKQSSCSHLLFTFACMCVHYQRMLFKSSSAQRWTNTNTVSLSSFPCLKFPMAAVVFKHPVARNCLASEGQGRHRRL